MHIWRSAWPPNEGCMHKQLKQNAAKMVRNGLWELDDTDSSGF